MYELIAHTHGTGGDELTPLYRVVQHWQDDVARLRYFIVAVVRGGGGGGECLHLRHQSLCKRRDMHRNGVELHLHLPEPLGRHIL